MSSCYLMLFFVGLHDTVLTIENMKERNYVTHVG